MSLENKIDELKRAIEDLTTVMVEMQAAKPEEPAPKAKKPKSEPKPEIKVEVVEYQVVADAAMALLKSGTDGRDKLIAILERFGAKRVSDLAEADYAKALKRIQEAQND